MGEAVVKRKNVKSKEMATLLSIIAQRALS